MIDKREPPSHLPTG